MEADFHETIRWAEKKARKWAFTTSNAGSHYFDDYADPERLDQIDWTAVGARYWQDHREGKQAEFLIERSFPWKLVRSIGVLSKDMRDRVRPMVDEARPSTQAGRRRTSWLVLLSKGE